MKAILLASGYSKRFQGNKLLEQFLGKPLYCHTLDMVMALPFEEIIVVTQYQEILQRREELKNQEKRITFLKNKHPEEGIASSVRLGIREAGRGTDVMFFVCDQPYLKKETVHKMIERFKKHSHGILCAVSGERSGNPNIFSSEYYEEFLELVGDKGGKVIIKNHPEAVQFYQVEEEELKDIDYREDFC